MVGKGGPFSPFKNLFYDINILLGTSMDVLIQTK